MKYVLIHIPVQDKILVELAYELMAVQDLVRTKVLFLNSNFIHSEVWICYTKMSPRMVLVQTIGFLIDL